MEFFVFVVSALIVLGGAVGVIMGRNPVHSALSLVATLFGVAVLFIAQDANFLAAVQVMVYAGAIVVLFLFVIMLLGVDQVEDLSVEPIVGQRFAAVVVGLATLGLTGSAVWRADTTLTGRRSALAALDGGTPNVTQLARLLFTDYVFAFEATAILLTIAVVGAVVLARRAPTGKDASSTSEPAEAAS